MVMQMDYLENLVRRCLCKDKPNADDEQHISIRPGDNAMLTSVCNRSVTKLHVSASPVIQEEWEENEEQEKDGEITDATEQLDYDHQVNQIILEDV